MIRARRLSLLPAFALLLGALSPLPADRAFAATFTADSDATLRSAIDSANASTEDDTIDITADITLTADLPNITKTLTIDGGGHTIDGNDLHRAINVKIGGITLVINDLILTRNQAPSNDVGGAINVAPSSDGRATVTLNRVTLSHSSSWYTGSGREGGGLNCSWTNLTVNDSLIHNNRGSSGGGIAIAGSNCEATINRSAIYDNTSNLQGGGVAVIAGATATINNSSIFGNTTTTMLNDGGGIHAGSGATLHLNHVTVTGNTAKGEGANKASGISITTSTTQVHLRNSIVYGNTSGDCKTHDGVALSTNSGNAIGSPSSCGAGTGGLSADPQLPSAATGSPPAFALPDGSPAIDAVDCLAGVTEDQFGTGRPSGGNCDIGAYEALALTFTVTAIPACGSTATDMSTPVQYGLELVPAPAPGTQMNTDWVVVNDGGAHLANWQGALRIQDSGSTYFATGSTLAQYRAAFPGFAGFRFRLRDQPTIWTSCTWRFDDGGNGNTGGGNPPPTNDNPPPANDNPPPTNNNPPPTDTGGGGGGFGGGGGGGGGSLASDASLRALTVRASAGGENFDETLTLVPDFDADTLEYAAAVPFSMTHARLTPRTVNPDATVRIGPRGGELSDAASGEPGPVLALAVGENVFEVAVTAEDEETAQTYAVTVTRAPPPLRGLTLRAGDDGESFDESSGETLALTPAFEPSVTEYAAAALFSMTHARLTPELGQEDATAQIGPRGGERSDAASGAPGPALALTVGENVFEVAVTAAGGTAATYTVTVTRPAPPVPLDATAARQHLFPLLADGDGFRVRLFLTNVSAYPRNACALTLHGAGLDAGRFEAHPALTVSDGALEIDSGPTGAGVALATGGAGELAFGYARLACAEPAAARLLLARESGGVPAALANQEGARAARLHRFPLLSRLGRPGLALANDGDAAAACAVEVETAAGESAGGGNVAVPARGVAFRFVDEIASRENGEEEAETDGGAVTVTCDRPVAALGLPLTAAGVFTALGGAVPETDETTEEAEAVPARRVLPLVLDGAGFRSRLEVANLAGIANSCTLHFHGAGVNTARFPSSANLVRDGFRRATFELPQDERISVTSFGRHSYAYGYAALDCEGPAEARVLLTAGDGDEADGMAPIPPAQFAREVRFPVAPGLDRMAIFLTNSGEVDAACTASLTPTGGEETAAAASIEVGAESTALRFLADLFALPADFAGGSAALSCDREIAAVALPATAAAAFAAVPPVARGFRDDAQDAEE